MFENEFEGKPGPELFGELASMNVSTLHPIERSWALTGIRQMESWLAAQQCRLLLELGSDFERCLGGGNAADEVMAAHRVSAYAAERHVRLARSAGRAPALLEALESGRLGVPHAHRLSQHLEELDTPEAAVVAARVCADERLPLWSVGDVGRAAARVAAELDPAAAAQRRRRQQQQSDVTMEPAADGMAWLTAYGPAEDIAAALTAVNAQALAARRVEDAAGEERTPMGVLRLQAAVRLMLGGSGGGSGSDESGGSANGSAGGSTVVTHVTVPYRTLAGIEDAPGELSGYGPIPAHVARDLASRSGVWWRLLTDPATGELCPAAASPYRIPDAVRRFVAARDQACSHPGCDQPAARCDIDHGEAHPWGPTCACNLSPRCRRHHNAKTHHRWQVRTRLDGRHVTVSPTGRVYPTAIHPPPGPLPERVPDPPDEDDEAGDFWAGDDALSGLDWDVGAAAGELDWGAIGDSAVWNGADDSGNDNVDDRDARGDFGSFDDLVTYLFDPTTGRNDPVVEYVLARR